MPKEKIEKQIHDWWLDYQIADGTEDNLLKYVEDNIEFKEEIAMTEKQNAILEYLETSLTGAKILDDEDSMLRIFRAIVAFKSSTDEDIFVDGVIEKVLLGLVDSEDDKEVDGD